MGPISKRLCLNFKHSPEDIKLELNSAKLSLACRSRREVLEVHRRHCCIVLHRLAIRRRILKLNPQQALHC